ncbi:MAG: hypothetical protein K2X46_09870 [Roseomonas sp.]|nr:hypothetical protein [Roseomonas sp.]
MQIINKLNGDRRPAFSSRNPTIVMTRPLHPARQEEVAVHRMVELAADAFAHLPPRVALEKAAGIHATAWRWIIVGPETDPKLMLLGKR